ncbi:transporter [Wenyingzhuangia sp. IMCC45574]
MYFQYRQSNANRNIPLAKDHVNTVTLSGQYQLTDYVQINALLPYRFNNRYKLSGDVSNSGIGDVSVYGMANVLHSKSRHRLKFGVGFKMPTGKFDLQNSSLNQTSAAQLGTGSWDLLLPFQYNYKQDKWFVNISAMYFLKGENNDNFKFGNQTQVSSQFAYKIPVNNNKLTVVPKVGVSYDHFLPTERFHIVDERTSGHMTSATFTLETYVDKYIVGVNYQTAVSQELIRNEVKFNKGLGIYCYYRF